ncbi:MAG: response regulator [Sulfuricella sp.]|nr:response regulator [Sulfuricella sp.]
MEEKTKTVAEAGHSAIRIPHSTLDGPPILIVEDSPIQAELLRRLLAGAGYRVAAAKDGAEGLALAQREKPAVIVSDINMPVMNGFEMCQAIRRDETLCDVPVILLTTLDDIRDVIRGLNAGADSYVTKPYNEEYLLSRIGVALADPHRAGEIVEMDVTVDGKTDHIVADCRQILNLLVSTYGNAVLQNRELLKTQDELNALNDHLERKVQERTAALGIEIIERRKAQEELQLKALLLDNVSDSIFVHDLDGNFVYLNEAAWKSRGYTRKELMGMNLHLLDVPEYEKLINSRDRELVEQGPSIFESAHRCKDGSVMPIEVSARHIESGGRKLVLGTVRDITERKRNEDILVLQTRRAQALLELPQVAEQMDEAAFMQRGQELAEQVTGSEIAFIHFVNEDEESIELVTWSRRTLENYCTAAYDNHYPVSQAGIWADALRRRAPVMFNDYLDATGRRGLPEGHAELKRIISVPVIENGKVVMLAGVGNKAGHYTDLDMESVQLIANEIWRIVQRQRTQAQLRKLSLAIEQSPESIVITGLNARIEYVNEAFLQVTGYDREEVLGRNPRILHSGKTPAATYRDLWATLAQGNVWQGEFVNRRKDGSEYVEFASISPIRQADGRITHYLAIKENTTEKKRIAAELEAYRHHLEDKVNERTKELDAARQAAESANQTKSDFLASMSHELRTPLNAIIGFSEMLKDGVLGDLSDAQKGYIGEIFASGEHLLALINDILDLSKVEAGKMELELEPQEVAGLVQGSTQIVREKATAHRLRLSVEVQEGLDEIWLDARKAKQILYNLLSNAVKFTPDGGAVQVTARRAGREAVKEASFENYLEVAVSDNGIGIAETDMRKLFQPFTQIDSTLARKYEGTGLGLAMVKRLAALHGGAVAVQSELGKGSTFTVWLPWRMNGDQAAVHPQAPSLATPQLGRTPLALIVEDDDVAADLIRIQLEDGGFRAIRAATAESALELAAREKPDVVTLDILLPGMDGWEFLERIKHDAELERIPVVIISIVADTRRGTSLGAAQILQKPIRREDLIHALETVGFAVKAGVKTAVLVVDDDPAAVQLTCAYLDSAGYCVLRAYGGQEGIDMAKRQRPDLIILDLMMPEISGFDVVEALKDDPATAAIPILIVTAKRVSAEDRAALNGNVMNIMAKSEFDRGRFLNEVKRAMTAKGG